MSGDESALLAAFAALRQDFVTQQTLLRVELDTSIQTAVAAALQPLDDRIKNCESLFEKFEARLKKLEQERPSSSADLGPPNKRRAESMGASRSQTHHDQVYKIKVKGFPENTFKDEIVAAIKHAMQIIGRVDYKEIYAPGRRANTGFVVFTDLETFKEVLKITRSQKYQGDRRDFDQSVVYELSFVPHITPEAWNDSKHTRIFTRIIAEFAKIPLSDDSWKLLSADHRNKEVYLGRLVIAEFRKKNGPTEEKEFVIHEDRIRSEALRMQLTIDVAAVKAAFETEIAK